MSLPVPPGPVVLDPPIKETFEAGIVLVAESLCLSIGMFDGEPAYVSVLPVEAGQILPWKMHVIGEYDTYWKGYISTLDEFCWWTIHDKVPTGPFERCISFTRRSPARESLVVLRKTARSMYLEAPWSPGGDLGPMLVSGHRYYGFGAPRATQIAFVD